MSVCRFSLSSPYYSCFIVQNVHNVIYMTTQHIRRMHKHVYQSNIITCLYIYIRVYICGEREKAVDQWISGTRVICIQIHE